MNDDLLIKLKELNALATPHNWKADEYGLFIFGEKCPLCSANDSMVLSSSESDDILLHTRGWGHLQQHGEEQATDIQKANANLVCLLRNNLPRIIHALEQVQYDD